MPIPDLDAAFAALGLDPDNPDDAVEVGAVTEGARRVQQRAVDLSLAPDTGHIT